MPSSDPFGELRTLLADERQWPAAMSLLSQFTALSVYVGSGSVDLMVNFEFIAADDRDPETASRHNAVTFGLAFRTVSDLEMADFSRIRTFRVEARSEGGFAAEFGEAQPEVKFRFAEMELVGERWHRAVRGSE